MTFNDPLSPPSPSLPPPTPNPAAQPEEVEGVVSERRHQPLPEPAIEPSAPPSIDTTQTMLPFNRLPPGMTEPNTPQPNLVPAPSPGREGVPERVQPNGTASSQLSPSPVDQYFPPANAPAEADPLHVPNLP